MKINELKMSELTGVELESEEWGDWDKDEDSYEKFERVKNLVESAPSHSVLYMYHEVFDDGEDEFNDALLDMVASREEPICVKSEICYSSEKGRTLSVAAFGNSVDQIVSMFHGE